MRQLPFLLTGTRLRPPSRGISGWVAKHPAVEGRSEETWDEGVVRVVRNAVLAFAVLLAAVEVGRIIVLYGSTDVLIAVAATAVFLPLHLWHLTYGLRGERPPGSAATLLVMTIAEIGALALIGPAWSFMLAALATSGLIVLRPRAAAILFVACVAAPAGAAALHPARTSAIGWPADYYMESVTFRACLQFALLWAVAGANELLASRAALAREAAERERRRLETVMRDSLERSLQLLSTEARRAREAVLGPGVGAALLALDQVWSTATQATEQLKAVLALARRARAKGGEDDLSRMRARTRTPVGRALVLTPAWRWFVAIHVIVLQMPLLGSLGVFGDRHAGPGVIPGWVLLTANHLSSMLDIARGRRPRWALQRFILVLAVSLGMTLHFGPGWRDPGWYAVAAAMVALTGRTRVAVVTATLLLFTWLANQGPGSWYDFAWGDAYYVALTALGATGLYCSARLIAVLRERDEAREAHIRGVVANAQQSIWGDVHDVLGQTLTAITLKTDVARRMITRDRDRALSELDELTELADRHAQALGALAQGTHTVTLAGEIDSARRLLLAAGVNASTEIEVAELEPELDAFLGWVVREATTNILRHTAATYALIRLSRAAGQVTIEIENDGARPAGPGGTGLRGLAQRARARDGELAQMRQDERFLLRARIPERVTV